MKIFYIRTVLITRSDKNFTQTFGTIQEKREHTKEKIWLAILKRN